MKLKAGDVLEVFLPSGRLFVIDSFPEPTAREHLEAHVGKDRFGNSNMEKTTCIQLQDGQKIYLTPDLKRKTLFFIYPNSVS